MSGGRISFLCILKSHETTVKAEKDVKLNVPNDNLFKIIHLNILCVCI